MSKNCSNCSNLSALDEEQKSKIQLLETRLKDLIRAYKVVCKERDNLQAITQASLPAVSDVDSRQQKRIAELEESVCHMSELCGKLELTRKQDQETIKQLQEKYQLLSNELDETKSLQKQLIQSVPEPVVTKQVQLKNNHTQTDNCDDNNFPKCELIDHFTQTDNDFQNFDNNKNENKTKNNETAVVAPLPRNRLRSDSELSDSSHQSISETVADTINDTNMANNSNISLYHINELARKELELADYRLRIREYECSIRELQWNYTNDKYRYQSRISDLELLNRNLMTSNNKQHQLGTNNNINVAYVKNVLHKLLETTDKKQRQLMINALIAALDSMQTSINS